MNEEIYEGTPAKEDVLIGTDSGYNRYRRPDGSTYVHYPYSRMAAVTAYSAKDKNGQPIRTAKGKLITGKTQAEADRNRFRYDMSHWVEANRRKTAHLPEGWRERIVTPDMNTFNAITGGVFNLTPIQVGRGVYNLSQGKDPGFILGNSGVVSEEYAQEHPWLALGANILGEGLTNPVALFTGKLLYNVGKNTIKTSSKKSSKYTQNLIDLLGDKKTSHGYNKKEFRSFSIKNFEKYLKSLGVDVSKFSNEDLKNLMELRKTSIINSLPKGRSVIVDLSSKPRYYDLYEDGLKIGELKTSIVNDKLHIGYIENLSNKHKGISRDLLDAALIAGELENLSGLISGEHLLSPEQTKYIWSKYYPKRKLISKTGRHEYNNGKNVFKSGESFIITNGEVVDLVTPSLNIPTKSLTMFHPSMIDESTKTLKPPIWNDPNIYKIGMPIIGFTSINTNQNEK